MGSDYRDLIFKSPDCKAGWQFLDNMTTSTTARGDMTNERFTVCLADAAFSGKNKKKK